MRTLVIALTLIFCVATYQMADGESAKVTGGVSCGENGIGGFDIRINGEIDSTTVDKVRKLFDEQHEIDARGGATNVDARPNSSVKCTSLRGRLRNQQSRWRR